ncbi:MAG: tagaturonate epimerase [Halanaerobiales bacterium]|nr:tagaturonate epimerase [Halanaerobiales bacterium]
MNWNVLKDLKTNGFEYFKKKASKYDIYKNSIQKRDNSLLFISKTKLGKDLIILNQSKIFDKFQGRVINRDGMILKIAPLNHENAEILREEFEFTNPVSFGKEQATFGLGDRLGIATPGHILTIKETEVKPIFAQQSVRELNLTDRTYQDVLDDVTWAVFQEGYTGGYGADGDHLKSAEEVNMALEAGYTMITLDCSEHINNDVNNLSIAEIDKSYDQLPAEETRILEDLYLNKSFQLGSGRKIAFERENFKKIVLIYNGMLKFTRDIYFNQIKSQNRGIDFEVSIDETSTPTTPQAHYFVAAELERAGVDFVSLAPRFCGEFQKGIDYIGSLEQFEDEFKVHAEIADHFGYKLSIHSGSDKFSVYPIIGKYTKGRVHVKTSGTNWLEAMRVVAEYAPGLYREIHSFSLKHFEEATRYYHVTI